MRFPYKPYQVDPTPALPGIKELFRPMIPIRLVGSLQAEVYYGLLDTGSDETYVPLLMAYEVGIPFDSTQTGVANTAGGDLLVRYGKVTFELFQGREKYRWSTMVGVVNKPWPEMVLGRAGFLRYFDVTFLGKKQEIRLRRNRNPFPGNKI